MWITNQSPNFSHTSLDRSGTDHLLATGLLGTEVTWAEPGGIAAAIRPDTGLVICETPAICELLEEYHPEPPLIGRTLRMVGFRERYRLQVLALRRYDEDRSPEWDAAGVRSYVSHS